MDHEEEEETSSRASEQTEMEEEENELVLLDPSHPLMERVQAALKEQLTKQRDRLEIELREKQETMKSVTTQRENIGVELYGIQQQLARQQMLIEKEQDGHSAMAQLRKQTEENLKLVQDMYHKAQQQLREEEERNLAMRTDVETAVARLQYLSNAQHTMQQDIALTKRATEKTTIDVSKAQESKLEQDMYLDKLTQEVQQMEEHNSLLEAQWQAQAQDTKAMKEAVTEATMEMETLLLEKKRLMQQWKNSLIGMKRRNEAYSAMVEARSIQEQQQRSMDTELNNYKKTIAQEQLHNEQLTLLLNKVQADINHVQHLIDQCSAKRDALKADYMTYTRTLQETEQALAKVETECTLKKNELKALRTQIEHEAMEKRQLEDSVMEKMMQRLTMDKATKYTKKTVDQLHRRAQELEILLVGVENSIAQKLLDTSDVTSRLKHLNLFLEEQNSMLQSQNELINRSELEISRSNGLIERKQTQIDQINKKIEQQMSKQGGEDLGPMELKIDGFQQQISTSLEQCSQMHQQWLRQQNELVKKTQTAEEQTRDIDTLQKRQLILAQKKLRVDGELAREQSEGARVQHNIDSLQKDMVRLNTLVTEKRGQQEQLEHNNILLEKDFIHTLKDTELEFIQLQNKSDQLKEEKERMLNSLFEAEHQVMLWERKIQLAKEMRESVDSEAGQQELRRMKSEIHRMQVQYNQLIRHQEKLIQDMEKAVYRRESIIWRSDAQKKSGRQDHTVAHLKGKLTETRRKVKQTQRDANQCEQRMKELTSKQDSLAEVIQQKQTSCLEKRDSLLSLQTQIEDAEALKRERAAGVLSTQQRVKHLGAAKDSKYKFLHRAPETRTAEMQRQREKMSTLLSIVHKLEEDHPDASGHLKPLAISIRSHVLADTPTSSKEVVCT